MIKMTETDMDYLRVAVEALLAALEDYDEESSKEMYEELQERWEEME